MGSSVLSISRTCTRVEQQAPFGIHADGGGLATPEELHAFALGVFILEVEGGDVALAAAIEQVDGFSAETARGVGGVDGGVTGADDDDRSGEPRRCGRSCSAAMKFERIRSRLRASSPGTPRRCMAPRPTPRKMKSNSAFELRRGFGGLDLRPETELDAHAANQSRLSRRLSAARSLYSATP